jgi:putative glycosyltransferase (TIGR04372 family)
MSSTKKILVFKLVTAFFIPFLLIILYISRYKYKIRIALLNVNRIGHLVLNTEVSLRGVVKGGNTSQNNIERLILIAPTLPYHNVSNEQLVKMFVRHENVYQSWFFYRFISVWYKFLLKTQFFFRTSHATNSAEYELFNATRPTISFNVNEVKVGNIFLNKIGVGNKKYVCVFQRDSNYLKIKENKSQEDRDCRDADIDAIIPSIRYLIDKGYYVIRVGSLAKDKVSFQHKMFIDYPFTKYVSDFNDIYIVANSSFLVGASSGICDVAALFDVPRLVINAVPFGHSTVGKKTMFIPKKLSKKGSIVPFFDKHTKSLIEESSCDVVKKKGYNYIDNTEDEILDAVKDFIQYLSFDGILESDYLADMNIYFNSYLHNTLYDSVKVPLCPSWYYDNYKLYYDA